MNWLIILISVHILYGPIKINNSFVALVFVSSQYFPSPNWNIQHSTHSLLLVLVVSISSELILNTTQINFLKFWLLNKQKILQSEQALSLSLFTRIQTNESVFWNKCNREVAHWTNQTKPRGHIKTNLWFTFKLGVFKIRLHSS